MSQSEQINELAAALSVAQGKITGALKDSANPFFKSKYADLASVWDACRSALSENGLAVIQTTEAVDPSTVTVVTTLAHKSGQYIKGILTMVPKDPSPQAIGSCLTYARRYALAAIVGVAQVDDDANAASGKAHPPAGWTGKDTKDAKFYRDALVKAIEKDDDAEIKRLGAEFSGDQEFYLAVFAILPKPLRARVSGILNPQRPLTEEQRTAIEAFERDFPQVVMPKTKQEVA